MKSRFKQYLHMLNPDPLLGGLEVSDSAVRFVLLNEDGSVAEHAVVSLPAGTVTLGRITDETAFRAACRELRRGIRGFRAMPVILSLPPAPVYAQVFAVPAAR